MKKCPIMNDLKWGQAIYDLLDEAAGRGREGWGEYYDDRDDFAYAIGMHLGEWIEHAEDQAEARAEARRREKE